VRLAVRSLPGDPSHIRLGLPLAPLPRSAAGSPPKGAFCAGGNVAETGLLMPSVAASGLTPAGLLQTAPQAGSRWSVAAVLVAGTESPVRLCAAVLADGRCRAGAEVDNFPRSFLPAGEGLRVSALWLVLVEDGALADPIRAA
jgi:hypothetical protein